MHTEPTVPPVVYSGPEKACIFHEMVLPPESQRGPGYAPKAQGECLPSGSVPRNTGTGGAMKNGGGRGAFVGGIVHNFNNLLMGINGYVELLLLGPECAHQQDLLCIRERIHRGSSCISRFFEKNLGRIQRPIGAGTADSCVSRTFPPDPEGERGKGVPPEATVSGGIVEDLKGIIDEIEDRVCRILLTIDGGHLYREPLLKILNLIGRGDEMIRQLSLCGPEKPPESHPVRLDRLVRDVMDAFGCIMKNVTVHHCFTEDLAEIMADPCQIGQVVENLCLNATDAMPSGGRLFLEADNVPTDFSMSKPPASGSGRFVRLTVRDTGEGMDEETVRHIFEPFYTTKGLNGRGLGLSSADSIVRAHGGRIDVDSEPGGGTTFRIFLPVCPHTDSRTTTRAAG